jgi:hypothetical protein
VVAIKVAVTLRRDEPDWVESIQNRASSGFNVLLVRLVTAERDGYVRNNAVA